MLTHTLDSSLGGRVLLGFAMGCLVLGVPLSFMLSQLPSLLIIGSLGVAVSLLVLFDNLRQSPGGKTEKSSGEIGGFIQGILGEQFRQGVQEAQGKTPTTPSQMGEKAHREARKQAENMEQDVDPETLLNGMGASNSPIEAIDDQESIQYLLQSVDLDVNGDDNGSLGYALVTDSRIMISAGNLSIFTTEISSQHSISYRDISDVSTGTNMLTTTLEIRTPGHEYEITGFDGVSATKMAEYIRRQVSRRDNPTSEHERDDSLDKLERLSDLREKGAISETEYKNKKEELLSDV